ncbi:flavin reductase [Collimonas pratensis]|uniref:Flavin reductase like domain protein n=1 Tax=Collimonas pratensis TaxID=279113 RepID=A0ABM5Z1B8_9BURK|nr:flavin reductase [Collimonas pratensis]AMP12761.1 flavin reductase like domain protein [Collimonas pratensis]
MLNITQVTAERTFDQREFRHALSTFTTGVTIITACCGQGKPVGVTANSFNSVSLDPPLVLWSLSRSSSSLLAFEEAKHWAVHILSHDQDALATRFSKRGHDKFADIEIESGVGGVPLLSGCTTRIQCKTTRHYDGGDHVIMIGEVIKFDRSDMVPLVYQRGSYAIATRKEVTVEAEAPTRTRQDGSSPDGNSMTRLLGSAYFQLSGMLREYGAQQGLNDAEFFLLNTLAARDGLCLDELNRLFINASHSPLINILEDMATRGVLKMVADKGGPKGQALFYLTSLGHDLARKIADAGKQTEQELLGRLGTVETIALRTLLRRFVGAGINEN